MQFRPGLFLAALSVLPFTSGQAAADNCRVLDVQMTPTPDLQIVVWLEDAEGRFVDTLFITRATGSFGLGNRPGIRDFNSEFLWPYGRRESLFPVWAHRHGVSYPKIIFQDEEDRDLSHAFSRSSLEPYYCRPLKLGETALANSLDAGSCATTAFTDKGKFERAVPLGPDAGRSFYPPRRDVVPQAGVDHGDVAMYPELNDLDAITQATPPGGLPFSVKYSVPSTLAAGTYTIWVEVSKEFDQNGTYHYPSPQLTAYGDYGSAYRGQPSIVWKVPLTVDHEDHLAQALDYSGYGDPDGLDGNVRIPDPTISTGAEGSGVQRLLTSTAADGAYRVRVESRPSDSGAPPAPPEAMQVAVTETDHARVTFVEPAGAGTTVTGYEVRLSVGQPLTAENFTTQGESVSVRLVPSAPGGVQTVDLTNLLPQTHYWVGIRALDTCLTSSTPSIVELVTPMGANGEVSWCFVATAAWGSPMMPQVAVLRGFRDQVMRKVAIGEILVESYYTFAPALAAVIRPSETLRSLARTALGPIVDKVAPKP